MYRTGEMGQIRCRTADAGRQIMSFESDNGPTHPSTRTPRRWTYQSSLSLFSSSGAGDSSPESGLRSRRCRSTAPPSASPRPSCLLPQQLQLPLGASLSGCPRRRPRSPPLPFPPPRPPLRLLPSAPRDPAAGFRRRRSGAPHRRRRTLPRAILDCFWRWKGEAP